jgi:bloom syndrome protein
MGSESRDEEHQRLRSKSYRILEKARAEAARKNGYNSQTTRTELRRLFRERFGKDPYDWQLDVTEAILLGLDSIVIAGTGAGKTMPFMMPLLLDKSKKVIIVSPLKILQADQVQDILVLIWCNTYHFCRPSDSKRCRSRQLR